MPALNSQVRKRYLLLGTLRTGIGVILSDITSIPLFPSLTDRHRRFIREERIAFKRDARARVNAIKSDPWDVFIME